MNKPVLEYQREQLEKNIRGMQEAITCESLCYIHLVGFILTAALLNFSIVSLSASAALFWFWISNQILWCNFALCTVIESIVHRAKLVCNFLMSSGAIHCVAEVFLITSS